MGSHARQDRGPRPEPPLRPQVHSSKGDEPPSVRDRWWTDDAGVRWERRGTGVAASRFRRLLAQPEVRVVHVTPEGFGEVLLVEREVLRRRVERFGTAGERSPGDHVDFLVGEFRDGTGRRMVIVEERC